jgi:hypothetical protein
MRNTGDTGFAVPCISSLTTIEACADSSELIGWCFVGGGRESKTSKGKVRRSGSSAKLRRQRDRFVTEMALRRVRRKGRLNRFLFVCRVLRDLMEYVYMANDSNL